MLSWPASIITHIFWSTSFATITKYSFIHYFLMVILIQGPTPLMTGNSPTEKHSLITTLPGTINSTYPPRKFGRRFSILRIVLVLLRNWILVTSVPHSTSAPTFGPSGRGRGVLKAWTRQDMVQHGLSPMSVWTWPPIRNTAFHFQLFH
jgi:hypothetical protein